MYTYGGDICSKEIGLRCAQNMGTILGSIVDIIKGDLNDQFTRSGPMEGPLTLDLFICNTKMFQRPMRSHSLG